MIITYDNNYGSDADGNRGITVIDSIELDDSDFEDVKREIEEMLCGEEYDDYLTIYLPVEGTKEAFEVLISDYLTKDEYHELVSKFLD